MAKRKSRTRVEPIRTTVRDTLEVIETGIYEERVTSGDERLEFTLWFSADERLDKIEHDAVALKADGNERVARTASDVLFCLRRLRQAMQDNNHNAALLRAIALGEMVEMLHVRQREHLALVGLRVARRNAEIAEGRALTDEQLRGRWRAVQNELAKQANRGKRVSRSKAYKAVAERMDVSWQTVRDAFLAIDGRG